VFLDEGVFAVKGAGVEVEIEGIAMLQAAAAHGLEPGWHPFRITGRSDAATVLGEERALGDDVETSEERQSFVEHMAHDVAVPCVAEELEGEQRAHGAGGRDHGGAGELSATKNGVELARYEIREEEKEAAKLRVHRSWAEVELLHVGDVGLLGLGPRRPLLVEPSRQTRETFVAQDLIDGDRADARPSWCKDRLMS
jgi:hypothetical protein